MIKIRLALLAGFIALSLPSGAYASKEAFIEQKCNRCHSISALGVELKKGGDEEDEDDGEPVDLSHVGKAHDAAYLEGYLTKQNEHVPHDNVKAKGKHKTKMKGSEADVKAMATWLASLK